MKNRFYSITLIGFVCVFAASPLLAWDGAKTGKVSSVEATNVENSGFRIHLAGVTDMCGGQTEWAYINQTHNNYEVITSLLISAWLSEKTVTLYTSNVNGSCLIGHVTVP